jgi:hypothetical protein
LEATVKEIAAMMTKQVIDKENWENILAESIMTTNIKIIKPTSDCVKTIGQDGMFYKIDSSISLNSLFFEKSRSIEVFIYDAYVYYLIKLKIL